MSRYTLEERLAIAKATLIKATKRTAERKATKTERRERSKRIGQTAPNQRNERQRDNAYLQATRRLPCVIGLVAGGCEGRVEAAHLRFSDSRYNRFNPGKQNKPDDRWVNPCCSKHHKEQHDRGNEEQFWIEYGFEDVGAMCVARYAAFQAGIPGLNILKGFASKALDREVRS